MNNPILIQHKNTPKNVSSFFHLDQILEFDYSVGKYKDLDTYISDKIIQKIEDKNFDIVFIKDNLSSNYLELYGLRVAYHIRLTQELKDTRFIPIVVLSDIDGFTLNKIESISKILFTKNIFLEANTQETIKKYNNLNIQSLSQSEYQSKFLDLITVESPENSTNHSIANEWAIYQWSHLLDVSSETISKNTAKISAILYFKYLVAKYHLESKSKNKIKETKKTGNVLLIDDKWNEGWKDIIYSLLKRQYSDVKLDVLEYNFNNKSIEQIKASLEEKMAVTHPDVVLLDLRLLESDNTLKMNKKKAINKLSGIQLIDEIKRINPGIQIVMFTASGDSLILDELHNKGILGYVKKDAPGDKYESSEKSFEKLDTLIINGIDRSYLKEIWFIRLNLLKIINEDPFRQFISSNYDYSEHKDILLQEIKFVFEILQSDVKNNFKYAMVSIYTCFETIEKIFMKEVQKNYQFKDNAQTNVVQQQSLINRIIAILIQKLNIIEYQKTKDALKNIARKRNDYLHSNKEVIVDSSDIILWFMLLLKIIEDMKSPQSKKERKRSGIRLVDKSS